MPKRIAEPGDTYIAKSALGGRGVYAGRRFVRDELIETCPYLVIPGDHELGPLHDYVFDSGDGDSVVVFGYGCMYNHGRPSNLAYFEGSVRETFEFYATRDIEADEELIIDYGSDWWDTRDLSPKA